MAKRDPFANQGVDNDPLGIAQTTERAEWGLPSDEGRYGQHDAAVPNVFDYSAGILVGVPDTEADAVAPGSPHVLGVLTDSPRMFELPHEATHRRYEAPFQVPISQSAAGFLQLVPTRPGLHYIKLLACVIFVDALGSLKLVQGSNDGTQTADLTGAMPVGANAGFVLPPADISTPWMFTAPDQALGLFTVTSKATGYALCCYSPFDS